MIVVTMPCSQVTKLRSIGAANYKSNPSDRKHGTLAKNHGKSLASLAKDTMIMQDRAKRTMILARVPRLTLFLTRVPW